jgi:archaemetzincin
MQPKQKTSSKPSPSLCLVEMGRFLDLAVRVVAANLQALIGIRVDILDPLEVPREAFRERRGQYDAGFVLKHLSESSFPRCLRVLALTTADLCSPILTYVYGEAELGGRLAIVSNYRLRHDGDGSEAPKERYYERLVKVALHEVGHTFSLYHCDTPKCLMQFSPRIHDLDGLDVCFCERCEFVLHETLKHIHLQLPHASKIHE